MFFGATGDLAYKQISRAAGARAGGRLTCRSSASADPAGNRAARCRARASLEEHGRVDEQAFQQWARRLCYVDGDYNSQDLRFSGAQAPNDSMNAPSAMMARYFNICFPSFLCNCSAHLGC